MLLVLGVISVGELTIGAARAAGICPHAGLAHMVLAKGGSIQNTFLKISFRTWISRPWALAFVGAAAVSGNT